MQKKIIVICILGMFLLSVTGISAFSTKNRISSLDVPPEIEWAKTYGGPGPDQTSYGQQTSDGGYIIIGTSWSGGAEHGDIWVVKTDSNGNMEWNKTFGGVKAYVGNWIQQTSDGGYIILGSVASFFIPLPINVDIWLIKIDSEGNKEWDKTFGKKLRWEGGECVQQTSDGGYIILGNIGFSYSGVLLIKTDNNGNKLWEKTFGGTKYSGGYSIQQTSDGGYIIVGEKSFQNYKYSYVWLIKTDSFGVLEYERTFGNKGDLNGGYSIQKTSDGGYIIGGCTTSGNINDKYDSLLIKIDSNGMIEWENSFGGIGWDYCLSVQQTNDGGYILCGSTDSYGADNDIWVVKTDSAGNKLWHKILGGDNYDKACSIQQTSDGGYIVVGETLSFGSGFTDFWLIKLLDFENQRPNSLTFSGSTSGNAGESYVYTFSASDPDSDTLFYLIDWEDCTYENWIGPYLSGEIVEVTHTWAKIGTYNVKVKAMDTYGGESDWEALTVTMPRNRAINSRFLNFLQNHPNLFPILQMLLQRLGLQ